MGRTAARAHLLLSVRCTLTVSLASLDQTGAPPMSTVGIISELPASTLSTLTGAVPVVVNMPKAIWHFLSSHLIWLETTSPEKQKATGARYSHLDYILALTNELGTRCISTDEQGEIGEAEVGEVSVYDAVCVTILTRLLQRPKLRGYMEHFLSNLHQVPATCLRLLNLLMHAGTSDGTRGLEKKGTRGMAISTLSTLMLAADQEAAAAAMHHLLHAAICTDFEVRSKAIAFLSKAMLMLTGQDDYKQEMRLEICSFAVAAAANCVGLHAIQSRVKERDLDAEKLPKEDNSDKQGEDDADVGDGMEVVVEEVEEEDGDEGEDSSGRPRLLRDAEDNAATQSFTASPINDARAMDAHCRRMLHLLVQLALERTHMFTVLFDIYATAKRCQQLHSTTDDSAARAAYNITTSPAAIVKSEEPSEPAAEGAEASSEAADSTDGWAVVMRIIEADVQNVMLAVGSRATDRVFDFIADTDPLAQTLVVKSVGFMHENMDIPASPRTVARVHAYAKKWLSGADSTRECVHLHSMVISGEEAEGAAATLDNVVRTFGADTDTSLIKTTFTRLVAVRPPVLTKAALLASLIRMSEADMNVAKPSIQLCLKDTALFSSSGFKAALQDVIADETPPFLLMWTAIRASQKHNDVKDLVLVEIVPHLIRKRIWECSKDLWLGVVAAVKVFGTQPKAEPTLRALLGLPAAKLQQIIKVGTAVKKPLAELLMRLSPEERDEVVSGRWAGIEDTDARARADKEKLIKKEIK
jgi:hypothetical protein